MAGRKKLSEIDKAKSKASRFYWKHQYNLTAEFADEHTDKEVQFFKSDKKMGRPPLKLSLIQSRALNEYSEALSEYRQVELSEGCEPISDQEIIEFKKSDRAGRKAKDEVLHIRKYIRRTQRQIDEIKAEDDKDFESSHTGPGRPGMNKTEKIIIYQERITEAEENIKKLLIGKLDHEIIYYELFDLKNERRTLVVEQKNHSEHSKEFIEFSKDISLIDELIKPIQKKYDEALVNAGLKHVRSAYSSRARPTTEVMNGGWSDHSNNLSSVRAELSEVDKLKQEMIEMKKMMIEQSELIKALTNKP